MPQCTRHAAAIMRLICLTASKPSHLKGADCLSVLHMFKFEHLLHCFVLVCAWVIDTDADRGRRQNRISVSRAKRTFRTTVGRRRLMDAAFDYQNFVAKNPGAAVQNYASRQVVYAQGEPADALFYLIAGTVKVAVLSELGKEAVIAILRAGSFFGESCLNGHPLRTITVMCTSASRIARLPVAIVQRALANDPAFTRIFLSFLLGRTEQLKEDLINQLFNSSEKRLARILLTLAGAESQSNALPQTVTQEVLANMVGTTRSRINQFMNRFRDLGYVDYDGGIRVKDSLINIILSDEH